MATTRIISADSHVNPPKDLWTRDAPAKLKDRAPRVESTDMGDFWIVDSEVSGAIGLDSSAGRKPEDFKAIGLTYKDMRPGAYDPKARLEDMDVDGVDAEVLYFGGPVTQYPNDPELRQLHRPRYNDWMVELSKAAPNRLVGLAHVPLVDIDEGIAELKRIAKMGLKGFHCRPVPGRARRQAAVGPGLRAVLGRGRGDRPADELPHRRRRATPTFARRS